MKIKFSLFLAISAGLIACCAAYYSIFGLSQLFAGASTAVIIMASSLEFSKIVAVSFLHRYWKNISSALKLYLTIGVFVLICITSAGIYGFLSNAYQKTANKLEISEGELTVLTNKKDLFQKNINDNKNIIALKTSRIEQLTNIRITQESRLDAAANNLAKNKVRNDINVATKEIQKLTGEIDTLNAKNTVLLDSVNTYATKSIESKSNNTAAAEIGPLKYLSQLSGYPMDVVVNWFILLLIFVFDPLAVSLVIATNRVIEIENGVVKPPQEENPKRERKWLKSLFSSAMNIIEFIKKSTTKLVQKKEEKSLQDNNDVVESVEIQNPVIEDVEQKTNRGFSSNIPNINRNSIERIGVNKIIKDTDSNKLIYKRR
jgi:hypothetical protein